VDLDEKALEHATRLVKNNLDTLAGVGKVQKEEIPAILDRIHPSTDLASAADGVDFALEAVAEVSEVKREVFSNLEKTCPEDTVLASNTSGLDIFDIIQRRKSLPSL